MRYQFSNDTETYVTEDAVDAYENWTRMAAQGPVAARVVLADGSLSMGAKEIWAPVLRIDTYRRATSALYVTRKSALDAAKNLRAIGFQVRLVLNPTGSGFRLTAPTVLLASRQMRGEIEAR